MKRALFVLLLSISVLSAAESRPKITGVAHISLFAHDYEKSRAFYGQFLGFEEPYSLKNADGSPSMTFFKVNDLQYIELAPEKQAGSDRLNHYAIETDDAEAMRRYLGSRGVTVPDHVPKGRIGNLNFMIKDPEGHSIEIVQYGPESWTLREKGKFMPESRISNHMMHVGIIVTNLEAEKKFYSDVLGFTEIWRGSSTGTVLSWTNMKVPDGTDYVEFMLFKEAPAADKRGVSHHLCLTVPKIEAAVAELTPRMSKIGYEKPLQIKTGINRKRQVNLFDPDGTRTELMELRTIDGKPTAPSTAPPPSEESR